MFEDPDNPEPKREVGRPSKYDPSVCAVAMELGKTGASKVEIAYELGIGRTTMQRWEAEHEEFRVAMTRAVEASQVWWERAGRNNLLTAGFQSSMWSRSMAARFPDDWREKQDIDLNAKVQVTEVRRTIIDPRDTDA